MLPPDQVSITQLHRHLGANPCFDGGVDFCVWSPQSDQVRVELQNRDHAITLQKSEAGYHFAHVAHARVGDRYTFQFDSGASRPDPASRYQPEGVHGASEVVDREFAWTDTDWAGVARENWIIYELHVGTFTNEGNFVSAIDRLDELVQLGVTAIELMPVADSAGRWNWGYDGVNLFAVNRNFGTPDDLRQLVDAAHAKGLAVFLDVVYNHLGPEGNYLSEIGPYLSDKHSTAWGSAPNFDDPVVGEQLRRFFIANAVMWMDEYHLDGLRVDAVHCMVDESDPHVAIEMAEAVQAWRTQSGRPANLIAESNVYDHTMTVPVELGGCGFDAQWSDCFLHSVFAVLRPGEHQSDREYETASDLDQVLRLGHVFGGTLRSFRERQKPAQRIDTSPLVYSIQNHDFIGNHPLGLRLHELTSLATQRAAAALLILSPAIPMLFMGEEFACPHPFQFFVDFSDEHLRRSVVEGRRREYPQHDWSSGSSPIDPAAFYDSKIGRRQDGDADMLGWYTELIRIRKDWIERGLLTAENLQISGEPSKGLFLLRYQNESDDGSVAIRINNIADNHHPIDLPIAGKVLLDSTGTLADGMMQSNHAIVCTA